MGAWLLVLLVLLGVTFFALKKRARRRWEAGRQPVDLAVILGSAQPEISREVITDVWNAFGRAYAVDPKLIRPDDAIKDFSELDSWNLGKGDDEIVLWIQQRCSKPCPEFATVLDVARWVQKHEMRSVI